ncbi:MAG TPA: hypothetical protein VK184_21035 [Nostocaceae cyanobacterium]|nr:hypothetical protein [Nostocaceae cyanobacterium]
MSQTITESYYLNNEINLYISSDSSVTVYAVSLSFTKQKEILQECRLTFCVTPNIYQNIDTQALFNLKPEVRSPFSAGVFDSSTDIQIEASLDPDLLPNLAEYTTDATQASAYLQRLNQEEPNHPLFSIYSWYGLEVKQKRATGETGYRTLWLYLQPSVIAQDGISNEQISQAITQFAQELTNSSISGFSEENITQTVEQITKVFEKATEDISEITEKIIAEAVEELNDVFESLAEDIATLTEEVDFNQSIFTTIVDFFTQEKWRFIVVPEEMAIYMNIQGNNGQWYCSAKTREDPPQFVFYSISPILAPESKRLIISEFIARANYDVIIGNFELDFSNGEIRYKTSTNVENGNLSFTCIKDLVYTNIVMMDQYLPGIISIINGDVSAESAINQIEQNQEVNQVSDEFERPLDISYANKVEELALNLSFQSDVQQEETIPENEEHILTILTREEIGKFHEALQVLPRSRRRQAEEIIAKLKQEINTRLGEAGEEIFNQAHTFFSEVKIVIKNLKLIQRYSGLAHDTKLVLQNLSSYEENKTAIAELENLFWSINTRLQKLPTDNLEGSKEVELLMEIEDFRYQLIKLEKLIKN